MTGARRLGVLVVAVVTAMGGREALAAGQVGAEPSKASAEPPQAPRAATVPFALDHNRMIVEVELIRPDGTTRKAQAWVDTGNEVLIVTEPLARDLGLDVSVLEGKPGGESVETPSPAPGLRIGGLSLDVSGIATFVRPGAAIMPGVPAEVHLPAKALRHDHVVLDYPAHRLTVALPGVLEPRGTPIPCRVNRSTGLFMIEATIDGEKVALGLDNGSTGTWVSTVLTDAWKSRHPEWRQTVGALGSTNFWGFEFETSGVLMRLPEVVVGPLRVRDVAVLGLSPGLFAWYSRKSAGPVVGFLGANVLERFRIEVDFADETTWWAPGPAVDDHDLDIVGLTVRAEDDGGFGVAAVVPVDGAPAVEGVEVGDRLVRVGDLETAGATMGAVIDALRGEPGATRTLELERAGRRFTVEAKVRRFP